MSAHAESVPEVPIIPGPRTTDGFGSSCRSERETFGSRPSYGKEAEQGLQGPHVSGLLALTHSIRPEDRALTREDAVPRSPTPLRGGRGYPGPRAPLSRDSRRSRSRLGRGPTDIGSARPSRVRTALRRRSAESDLPDSVSRRIVALARSSAVSDPRMTGTDGFLVGSREHETR